MYICTQQYAFEAVEKKGVGGEDEVSVMRRQSLSFFISLFFNNSLSTEM